MARQRPVANQWGIPWPNESISPRRRQSIVANSCKGAAAGAAGAASALVAGTGTAQQSTPSAARPSRRPADGSRRPRRLRAARAARRCAVHPTSGLGLHGRRVQGARLRLRGREPRLGVRRHPRILDQPRRQPQAGDPDGTARGSRRRHRARLRQSRRQTDDDADARHGRPAARVDGPVPSVVRPRARVRRRRPPLATRRASSIARTARRTWARSCATS